MEMKKFIVCFVYVIFIVFGQFASASVVLLEDLRSYNGQKPQPPFSNWVVSGQNSQITDSTMSGNGSGYNGCSTMTGECYLSNSLFAVKFSVEAQQALSLTLALSAFPATTWSPTTYDTSYMSLSGPASFDSIVAVAQGTGSTLQGDVTFYGSPSLNLTKSFTLAPGEYLFQVGTNSSYWSNTYWSFSANFTDAVSEVPLPGAAWVFSSALTALSLLSRRKK